MMAFLVANTNTMAALLIGLIVGSIIGSMLGWDRGRENLIGHLRTAWRHAEQAGLVFGDFPPLRDPADEAFDNSYNVDRTWGGR